MKLLTILTSVVCLTATICSMAGFFLVPKMLGGLSQNLSTIIFFKPDYPVEQVDAVKKEIQETYPEIATSETPRSDTTNVIASEAKQSLLIEIPGMKMPQSLIVYTTDKSIAESVYNKYKNQEGVLEAYFFPEPFDVYNDILFKIKAIFGIAAGVFVLLFAMSLRSASWRRSNLRLPRRPSTDSTSSRQTSSGLLAMTLMLILTATIFTSSVFATQNMDKLVELEQKLKTYQEKLTLERQTGEGLKDSLDYINTLIEYSNVKLAVSQEKLKELSFSLENISTEAQGDREGFTKTYNEVTAQKEKLTQTAQRLYVLSRIANVYPQKMFDFGLYKSVFLNNLPFFTATTATGTVLEEKKVLYEKTDQKIMALKTDIQKKEAEIISYNSQVLGQKTEREWLLKESNSKEDQYSTLIEQIKTEIESINRAISEGIKGEGKKVVRGDIIAYEGNTGCSTGPHLHFGVFKDGAAVNPRDLLGGVLDWPMTDYTVTQEFGDNAQWYMALFGINGHNGMDMTGPAPGTPIKAARDGTVYQVFDTKVCSLTGTLGKGVVMDHGDGLKTVYWHVE